MNYDANTYSAIPPNTLRTRRTPSRNLDSEGYSDRPTAASSTTVQSLLNNPNTRTPSPIPSKHPSRANAAVHDSSRPPNTTQFAGSRPGPEVHRASSTSSAGFWEAPWSSIQGLASQFLNSSDASVETVTTHPPARRRRPLAATHDRITSAAPAQWGPQGTVGKELGKGSKEDRLVQVQAKKREGLLAANGHVLPDASGRFKRRDSDDMLRGSLPPTEADDRDALVYLHRVKTQDTLAGVMIKYNCDPNVFRKTNRLWPNDSIQIRKVVVLPVDACGVRGRKLPDAEPTSEFLTDNPNDDFMPTPTANHQPLWPSHARERDTQETPLSSLPSSPSISVTGPPEDSEPAWKHDSWVMIDGFVSAVEIARLPRRRLGFFPRSRRKSNSNSYSDIGSPPASSLDLPRLSYQSTSPRRASNKSRSSSNSNQYPSLHLHGPGGVGTLGKDVRGPGPAPDGLNNLFQKHLPNVAPRDSLDSQRSGHSTMGIENMGGKLESWVRKLADRAVKSVQPPRETEGSREGEVFELMNAGIGEAGGQADGSSGDSVTDEQQRMLQERFPPRGRVFGEAVRKPR
ncbi:MAG: hypothetical protein Q9216_005516 [Gyalolechia sp. 2 TL-2023]